MTTRYEEVLLRQPGLGDGLAGAMADAAQAARQAVAVSSLRESVIRDIAAWVAAPTLAAFALWTLSCAKGSGVDKLCFLARDGHIFYEIAKRLAPQLRYAGEMRYVASSRRTWSLAASDIDQLDRQDWLFNSFMRSNAADVCERLGLEFTAFQPLLAEAGAALDLGSRADTPAQAVALRRFVAMPEVAKAVSSRVESMRELVRDYAIQEGLTRTTTGLVDAGWTGRMIGALTTITEGLPQPKAYFFGHEPRATGWDDPTRISAFMYSTAVGDDEYRLPDMPFLIETFCMTDQHILVGYTRDDNGRIGPTVEPSAEHPARAWGIDIYQETIHSFCDHLDLPANAMRDITTKTLELRSVLADLLRLFWITPALPEAQVWGAYPYDSDPLARATRPLAFPFDPAHLRDVLAGVRLLRGERAWLQGSLVLSGPEGFRAAKVLAPVYHHAGAPATD